MSGGDEDKKAVMRRLSRVEGQVRGIIRMMEDNRSCEDILPQVAAARSAMNRVGIQILTSRMRECLEENPAKSPEDAVGEAIDIFLRFNSGIGPIAPEA